MNFAHSPFIAMPFSAKPSAQHFPLCKRGTEGDFRSSLLGDRFQSPSIPFFQMGKMQCKRAAENEPGFLKLPVSASKASAENMK